MEKGDAEGASGRINLADLSSNHHENGRHYWTKEGVALPGKNGKRLLTLLAAQTGL